MAGQRESSPITQLLSAARGGDESAQEQLWTVVYQELKAMARAQLGKEAAGKTLAPTVLVHEAFFRLFGQEPTAWSNRRHFFGAAARAMRQIRIDDARRRKRLKRGGENNPAALEEEPPVFDQDPAEVLAVHEALEELERRDGRQAQVVMLRYFSGLTEEETAAVLDVSRRTVQIDWRLARAWLHRELSLRDTSFTEVDE